MNQIHNRNLILRSQYLSQVVEVSRWCVQAMRSQKMKRTATHRNTRDKNCSSECCGVPGLAAENKHKALLYSNFGTFRQHNRICSTSWSRLFKIVVISTVIDTHV